MSITICMKRIKEISKVFINSIFEKSNCPQWINAVSISRCYLQYLCHYFDNVHLCFYVYRYNLNLMISFSMRFKISYPGQKHLLFTVTKKWWVSFRSFLKKTHPRGAILQSRLGVRKGQFFVVCHLTHVDNRRFLWITIPWTARDGHVMHGQHGCAMGTRA